MAVAVFSSSSTLLSVPFLSCAFLPLSRQANSSRAVEKKKEKEKKATFFNGDVWKSTKMQPFFHCTLCKAIAQHPQLAASKLLEEYEPYMTAGIGCLKLSVATFFLSSCSCNSLFILASEESGFCLSQKVGNSKTFS